MGHTTSRLRNTEALPAKVYTSGSSSEKTVMRATTNAVGPTPDPHKKMSKAESRTITCLQNMQLTNACFCGGSSQVSMRRDAE